MPVSSETTKSGLQPKFPSLNKNADLYKSAFFLFFAKFRKSRNIFKISDFCSLGFFALKRRVSMGSQRGGNPRQGMFAKKWIKMRNVIIKYANLRRSRAR